MSASSHAPVAPTHSVLEVLCCPEMHHGARDSVARAVDARGFTWGGMLEQAIRHRMTCVLASFLTEQRLQGAVPRRIMRHLESTLRTNQYKTAVFRAQAARIVAAMADADVVVAAVQGIAHESVLYGGRGARQFSDLDFLTTPDSVSRAGAALTDLGYVPSRPSHDGTTFMRTVDDPIVPCIAVDLATSGLDGGVAGLDVMRRRIHQHIPGERTPLPVLAPDDAFRYALGRLVARPRRRDHPGTEPSLLAHADALRLYATQARAQIPENGRAAEDHEPGWTELRRNLPPANGTLTPAIRRRENRP